MNEILKAPSFKYYKQRFAVVGNSKYFLSGRNVCIQHLRSRGFEAEGFDDFDAFCEYDPTCVIVLGITTQPKPNDKSKIWVAIQTEQFYHNKTGGIYKTPVWLKKSLPFLKKYDIIMDFSKTNVEVIEKTCNRFGKKNVLFYPLFFGCEFSISDVVEEKEYDILFVGWHSRIDGIPFNRRGLILESLQKKYKVYPPSNNLWGEKKLEAIRKSKICLNLHHEEARYTETMRLLDYFNNHAFVMSDRIYDSAPFVDGEDYISFFITELEKKIDYYLANDAERESIANHAFEKVKSLPDTTEAIDLLIDAVILEADKRNYPLEMKAWRRRLRRQWIYDHLPRSIRDRIM